MSRRDIERRTEEVLVHSDPAVLRLDERYMPQVLEGAKTSTIRTKVRLFCRNSDLVLEGAVSIRTRIKATRVCLFSDVSEEEAQKDGFQTKEELREALIEFYPDLRDETIVTIIEFFPPPRNSRE